ncbi:MAG: hypothetical protein KF795_34275, partial [Labilithrix sp.]|nr:hypothetical protein [Labilithrix sp.]
PPPRTHAAAATRRVDVETGHGRANVAVQEVDGRLLFEGDIEVPQKPSGAALIGGRWIGKTVPFTIAASLPHGARVADAIAHWEAYTALRFVPRTHQADYLVFTPGRTCSAHVGRMGGPQDVTLQAGEHIQNIAGADFSPTTQLAHYWFKDGLYTVGRSWNVDESALPAPYALPSGKTTAQIRDTAFAPNGDVYTWYRDGTVSVGTPSNLGAKAAPAAFVVPAGLSASAILGVAFVASGRVRAWYSNGTTSEGTAYDLGAHAAPAAFTLAAGQSASTLLAVGVAGANVYAWYADSQASGGTALDLAATYAPYAVTTPGHCGVTETIHEIGHAVGLQHEQTRWDRDQYVTIHWANIADGSAYNFEKHSASSQDLGGYDYFSIMHYGSYAFSKNGYATLVRRSGGALVGGATVLSSGDVATIAAMYP